MVSKSFDLELLSDICRRSHLWSSNLTECLQNFYLFLLILVNSKQLFSYMVLKSSYLNFSLSEIYRTSQPVIKFYIISVKFVLAVNSKESLHVYGTKSVYLELHSGIYTSCHFLSLNLIKFLQNPTKSVLIVNLINSTELLYMYGWYHG